MKRDSSGMVLLELLLALAVVSLLTVAGFRAFGSLGELLHRRNLTIMESARIAGLEADLKRAWDHRLAHRFQSGPWLVIEGTPGGNGNWLALRRLRMRTAGTDGEVSWWELDGGSWGRIEVNAEAAGEWLPGTAPVLIRFRFPEARSRQNQTGLTLRGDWR
jgi:hypothetical protein